jgi:hypothetical protein
MVRQNNSFSGEVVIGVVAVTVEVMVVGTVVADVV